MSHCITTYYMSQKMEMERMLKTLRHFHPDLSEEIFTIDDINKLQETKSVVFYNLFLTTPYFDDLLSNKYSTITHIDADVLVVDKIDELFEEGYDVIAGRNNSDTCRAGTVVEGFTSHAIDPINYVNSGIHTVSSIFAKNWFKLCIPEAFKHLCTDQDILNLLFHYGNYKTKILDPVESSVYWGTSFGYGTFTNLESWKDIIVVEDHLELNNKRIKMMHFAGGMPKPPIETLVTKDVYDFIMNIVGE
jgi:hypothetical protein